MLCLRADCRIICFFGCGNFDYTEFSGFVYLELMQGLRLQLIPEVCSEILE